MFPFTPRYRRSVTSERLRFSAPVPTLKGGPGRARRLKRVGCAPRSFATPPAPWHLTRRTGRAHTALALRVLCVADHRHARRGREFSRGPFVRPSAPICPGLPVRQRRVAEELALQGGRGRGRVVGDFVVVPVLKDGLGHYGRPEGRVSWPRSLQVSFLLRCSLIPIVFGSSLASAEFP